MQADNVDLSFSREEYVLLRQMLFASGYLVERKLLPRTVTYDKKVHENLSIKISDVGKAIGIGCQENLIFCEYRRYPCIDHSLDVMGELDAVADAEHELEHDLRDLAYDQLARMMTMPREMKYLVRELGKKRALGYKSDQAWEWFYDKRQDDEDHNDDGGVRWRRLEIWKNRYLSEFKRNGLKNLKFSWWTRLKLEFWTPKN